LRKGQKGMAGETENKGRKNNGGEESEELDLENKTRRDRPTSERKGPRQTHFKAIKRV